MSPPPLIENSRVVIVEKPAGSVAFSIGFPISLTRDRPDFPALLVAASYFGEHRMSGGVLYEEMREKRGLNYGDYAYIEHFPQGGFLMEPPQNVGRHYQIFQIWVRPVEPANAKFALRMALYQLDQLRRNGIPQEAFEQTRDFLAKHVNVLMRTERARLGYGIDDVWYGAGSFDYRLHKALTQMTRDDVNTAIKRYLRADRLVIAAVSDNAESLKQQLASDDPSPIHYNSPKADAVLEIDRIAEKWPLNLGQEDIKIVPVDQVFQK
jgi:zinc protease